MITQQQITDLHYDIDVWYDDYIKTDAADNQNEWYSQLKTVLDAAYGADNLPDNTENLNGQRRRNGAFISTLQDKPEDKKYACESCSLMKADVKWRDETEQYECGECWQAFLDGG